MTGTQKQARQSVSARKREHAAAVIRAAIGLSDDWFPGNKFEAVQQRYSQVWKGLRSLTYHEREIIQLRYGLSDDDGYIYTLEDIAHIFKRSKRRIRQIETEAVRKLELQLTAPAHTPI
jgi:DNA-directed RNA polymerase sigma subunit (sigma70/sigma32)